MCTYIYANLDIAVKLCHTKPAARRLCLSPGDTLYISPGESRNWLDVTAMSRFAVHSCIQTGCSYCQLAVGTNRRAAAVSYLSGSARERERL